MKSLFILDHPPGSLCARLLASIDPWLGCRTTLVAAFIAVVANKPEHPPE